jgi:hypothetical protein
MSTSKLVEQGEASVRKQNAAARGSAFASHFAETKSAGGHTDERAIFRVAWLEAFLDAGIPG